MSFAEHGSPGPHGVHKARHGINLNPDRKWWENPVWVGHDCDRCTACQATVGCPKGEPDRHAPWCTRSTAGRYRDIFHKDARKHGERAERKLFDKVAFRAQDLEVRNDIEWKGEPAQRKEARRFLRAHGLMHPVAVMNALLIDDVPPSRRQRAARRFRGNMRRRWARVMQEGHQ